MNMLQYTLERRGQGQALPTLPSLIAYLPHLSLPHTRAPHTMRRCMASASSAMSVLGHRPYLPALRVPRQMNRTVAVFAAALSAVVEATRSLPQKATVNWTEQTS